MGFEADFPVGAGLGLSPHLFPVTVARSWADVVKLGAKQAQNKAVKRGLPKQPGRRQRRANTLKVRVPTWRVLLHQGDVKGGFQALTCCRDPDRFPEAARPRSQSVQHRPRELSLHHRHRESSARESDRTGSALQGDKQLLGQQTEGLQ